MEAEAHSADALVVHAAVIADMGEGGGRQRERRRKQVRLCKTVRQSI